MSFAPGKTEADIINAAGLCRLLVKGFSPEEIMARPQMVKQESEAVLKEYLDGKMGLAGLHKGTEEACPGL